jgi:hypothetical protein
MKNKTLLIASLCICLAPVCKGQFANPPVLPEGVWKLYSVSINTNNSSFTQLQGQLPTALYYTCPEKIEIKNESECLFYFDNGETKKVFQYTYTDQGKDYLHFSFWGQTSIPERQYIYVMEQRDGQSLQIVFEDAEGIAGSPAASYKYHYSFNNPK